MPPRNLNVTKATKRPLNIEPLETGGYRVTLEYVVEFSDGSGQVALIQREFLAGPRKTGFDALYVDIDALIEAREGVVPD